MDLWNHESVGDILSYVERVLNHFDLQDTRLWNILDRNFKPKKNIVKKFNRERKENKPFPLCLWQDVLNKGGILNTSKWLISTNFLSSRTLSLLTREPFFINKETFYKKKVLRNNIFFEYLAIEERVL